MRNGKRENDIIVTPTSANTIFATWDGPKHTLVLAEGGREPNVRHSTGIPRVRALSFLKMMQQMEFRLDQADEQGF